MHLALLAAWLLPDTVVHLGLHLSRPEVFVHEQVVVELRVTHALHARPRWEAPPFEGFWAERLPSEGSPLEDGPGGEKVRTTRFRRALFPARPGVLEIPASRLWCRSREGEELSLEVGGEVVRVLPLPESGRPEGFSGVVGNVQLRADSDAREVELGKALTVTIQVFGSANLWDARIADLEGVLESQVEVFPARPRLVKSEHRGVLTARRIQPIDLVPTRAGRFTIPPLELPYFDPGERRYRTARSEPLGFRALAARPSPGRAPWEAPEPAREPPGLRSLVLPGLGLLLLAVLGYLASRGWRRRVGKPSRLPVPRPHVLLRRAEMALGTEAFPKRLDEALRAGIYVRHRLDPTALTVDEIAARIDDDEGVCLLRALERSRFTGDRGDLRALLARVRAYTAG